MKGSELFRHSVIAGAVASALLTLANGAAVAAPPAPKPKFSAAVAFDVSRPAREIAPPSLARRAANATEDLLDFRPDRGPVAADNGFTGDGALLGGAARMMALTTPATIAAPLLTFEGLGNQDNFNVLGFRVNPPDPVGDVGPNHYVEMINLVFAVYDKQGNLLAGPTAIGDLWADFAIQDCTDESGDPIVLYDQLADRWILSQFTTRGTPFYYNCIAISKTGDPTGE